MRKLLAVTLMTCLLLATVATGALAGDPHAVRNRWAGVGIGIGILTLGGLLLGGLQAPVMAPPPPVVYAPPPPVAYAPPPVVYAPPPVYAAPPVVMYAPPPVLVYPKWGPHGHWRHPRRW